MKNLKKLSLLVGFILIMNILQAQELQVNQKYVSLNAGSGMFTNLPKQKTAPKGSVYLNDNWEKSIVVLNDSSYISGVKAKYNFYSKNVELLYNDTVSLLFLSKLEKLILIEKDKQRVFVNSIHYLSKYPDLSGCDLIEVYADGRASLIAKLTLGMVEANYNTALDAGETSDTYYVKYTYYIINNGKLFKIRKNKGTVLMALNDQRDRLSAFIKQNKLKMKNVDDIAKVVKFYNSIYEETSN
jgi:hypothetical protein